MYILPTYASTMQFCSEPQAFDYQLKSYQTVSAAKTYLAEMLAAGYSIKLLAVQSTISPSTLYRLAAGKIQKPTNSTFRRLLSIYCKLVVLQ
jgi:AraC-like DNA-binding protein